MRELASPYQWGAGLLSSSTASRRPIQERTFVLSPSAQIPDLKNSCNIEPFVTPLIGQANYQPVNDQILGLRRA